MAIIKSKKLKDMNPKEMDEKLAELRLELSRELGFSEIGTVKNPGRVGELKRSIARIKTFQNTKKKAKSSEKQNQNKLKNNG